MRIRSSVKLIFVLAILAYGASPAGAQTAAPSAVAATGGDATASAGAVGFQRKTSLTPQEQLAEAIRHLERMEQSAGGLRRMLEGARAQRDIVKILCLNDKLSQVDVAIRSGRDRSKQLRAAVERNDAEFANHEFTILTVLRQRSEQLVVEANQCIGEETAFVGDTRTKVTVDPSIPPDETPYPATDATLVIGPPPCTSCTL